jgi:hypothetical protein
LPCVVGRRTGIPRHLRHCALCNQGVGDEKHLVFYCFESSSLMVPAPLLAWLCNVVVHEPGCAEGCYVFCHALLTVSLRERSQCVIIERFVPYTSFESLISI